MMYFNILLLIWETFYFAMEAEGFAAWCSINQTMFVTQGSTATFQSSNSSDDYLRLLFERRYPVYRTLARISRRGSNLYFRIPDINLVKRTQIVDRQLNESQFGVTITISNISMSDNGTYSTHMFRGRRDCWILFVMQLNQEPTSAIEENKPVYIYAHPYASLVNATMVWLLDGMSANDTGNFIQYDGFIWIAHVQREMFGRNVTYRAIQDNGDVNDANLTLNVTYGPDAPLSFTPNKAHYFLSNGQAMLDVYCTIDCNPPCTVLWDKNGKDNILSLGKVSGATTGEYTCIATRPGVDIVLTRSLTVQVEDNTAFTVAIAVLASVQAITAIVLGLCGLYIYTRNNTLPCQTCLKDSRTQSASARTTQTGFTTSAIETEMENYEELDPASRHGPPIHQYEGVAYAGKSSKKGVKQYENTKIA